MATEVVMPQMGESIAEGTITKWFKQVGDHVERDEPLFEISTDKVDAEIPSPAAGTLTEIRFKEGDTVEVNTTVAVLDGASAGTEAKAAAPTTAGAVATPEPAKEQIVEEKQQEKPVTTEPATLPAQTAASAATGTEVDQADGADGSKAAAPPPKTAAPKETVADPQRADTTTPAADASQSAQPAKSSQASAAGDNGATVSAEELRRTKSSPLVRKIAQEHGVDIASLEGTGLSGRVTKNDILSFIESGSPAVSGQRTAATAAPSGVTSPSSPAVGQASAATPAPSPVKPSEGDRIEQMTIMRKKISEHMVQSRRTSAHVTTVYEIDMSRIAKLREQNKQSFEERTGTKLTYMPFIFQAVNNALRKFPIFNAQVNGDQIIYKRDINLGMAVALVDDLISAYLRIEDWEFA